MIRISRALPFRIQRDNHASLTDQVTDGLRKAITTGTLKPGNPLPSLLDMASELQVSEITTRRAVRRLKQEGLVTARPGSGIQICPPQSHPWRGHVLYTHWSGASMYYHSILSATLAARFHHEHLLFTDVQATAAESSRNYPAVRSVLASGSITLAIVEGLANGLDRLLPAEGVPFIHLSPSLGSPAAARVIVDDRTPALHAMLDHCRACGIRRVVTVTVHEKNPALHSLFRKAGISCSFLVSSPDPSIPSPATVEKAGLDAVARWLDTRPRLPDALYFVDDFLARGGLLALAERGHRVPDDVQVITLANRGLGPVYSKPLTRLEMDPFRHGEQVAQCALDLIAGRNGHPTPCRLEPVFIPGETTRALIRPTTTTATGSRNRSRSPSTSSAADVSTSRRRKPRSRYGKAGEEEHAEGVAYDQ